MLVWCVTRINIIILFYILLYIYYLNFIFKLAAEGLNVVLISRTQAKLDKVASEISK